MHLRTFRTREEDCATEWNRENVTGMQTSEVVVATITLARNGREEKALESALEVLKRAGLPVVVTDGGSREPFIRKLARLGFRSGKPENGGLVRQVKASIRMALRQFSEKPYVLYTEPDKYPFFESRMVQFIAKARKSARFGVGVAARDARSFRTFPKGQQWAERFMNEATELLLGVEGDFFYGPLLLSRTAAEMMLDAPEEGGWGWRFWLMAKAVRAGLKVQPVAMDFPCPKEQRGEDSKLDRMYRLKQLRQNLVGLDEGLKAPLQ